MLKLSSTLVIGQSNFQGEADFSDQELRDPFWDVVPERGGDSSRFQLDGGWANWQPDTVNYARPKISEFFAIKVKNGTVIHFQMNVEEYINIVLLNERDKIISSVCKVYTVGKHQVFLSGYLKINNRLVIWDADGKELFRQ